MAKSAAPRMNVKLLRKIQRHILAEPRRFKQEAWLTHQIQGDAPACGTQACIAGWAYLLATGVNPKRAAGVDVDDTERANRLETKARKFLGIDEQAAARLFAAYGRHSGFRSGWPMELWQRYRDAATPMERAQAAADRIDLFIATKGAE